jgi:hypothetical protein
MSDLFHAYVIGGSRESAKAHIAELLLPLGLASGDPNFVQSEHITFTIENARTLKSWQELVPASGRSKVYIAYADFVTREAENALLKTLEEPVGNTHIIFSLPNPYVLSDTLLSRVRLITLANEEAPRDVHAVAFMRAALAERLSIIAKLLEKSDDDDASGQVRKRAVSFLNELEAHLAKDLSKNKNALTEIQKVRPYLEIPGASVRILLEALALAL